MMQSGPIASAVALPDTTLAAKPGLAETLSVYLRRRVLIVMFLGFSSGLPLALSGSTLLIWMRETGVDLATIGPPDRSRCSQSDESGIQTSGTVVLPLAWPTPLRVA